MSATPIVLAHGIALIDILVALTDLDVNPMVFENDPVRHPSRAIQIAGEQ